MLYFVFKLNLDFNMNFAKINDITIHFNHLKHDENKPTIVFSNSLGTDFRIWQKCVDDLVKDFSILLYDKRGHGLSGLGTPPYVIDNHVDDLISLIDELKISNALLVGLSVGGLIVQGVYHKRPELVSGLVLCDTAAKIGNETMWNERIEIARKGGLEALVEANMQRWFSPNFHKNRQIDLRGYEAMFTRTPLEGYIGTGTAIRDADFTPNASSISVPTTCVVGEYDGATNPELVEGTSKLIPGSKFEIIKDAGHIPCVEQPKEIIRVIREIETVI